MSAGSSCSRLRIDANGADFPILVVIAIVGLGSATTQRTWATRSCSRTTRCARKSWRGRGSPIRRRRKHEARHRSDLKWTVSSFEIGSHLFDHSSATDSSGANRDLPQVEGPPKPPPDMGDGLTCADQSCRSGPRLKFRHAQCAQCERNFQKFSREGSERRWSMAYRFLPALRASTDG